MHASVPRTKLDERISNSANRLITQRLCLLLAAMAAADGAEAGALLLNHAVQLTRDASNASQVSNPAYTLRQSACPACHMIVPVHLPQSSPQLIQFHISRWCLTISVYFSA